ncbi:MAG: ATP synthase F0 subunit B [Planctomycetes bacterium]|nr:ATP synthase F0 subunit B [Planctomycetota bacterium]MCB9935051.1 ATP synthase F0 subunit B [Planctomycetota bacterium]
MRFNIRILAIAACALLAPALFASDAEPSQHSVLHFSANLMFWEYVTFGIIFLVLGVKVIPIMLKQLGERQNRIKDALDKADQVRSEAEVLLRKHEEMMRNAHADAKKITDEAVAAAREAAGRIQADAEQAARETRERAQKEVEQLTRKAQAELRDQAVELALLASSRVLQKSLTGDDHRRLAQEAIAASGTMNN